MFSLTGDGRYQTRIFQPLTATTNLYVLDDCRQRNASCCVRWGWRVRSIATETTGPADRMIGTRYGTGYDRESSRARCRASHPEPLPPGVPRGSYDSGR